MGNYPIQSEAILFGLPVFFEKISDMSPVNFTFPFGVNLFPFFSIVIVLFENSLPPNLLNAGKQGLAMLILKNGKTVDLFNMGPFYFVNSFLLECREHPVAIL